MDKPTIAFTKHSSLDGYIDGQGTLESSEEAPDPDILDQVQMMAPAPLPQPAAPLQPVQGRSSSCYDLTSET